MDPAGGYRSIGGCKSGTGAAVLIVGSILAGAMLLGLPFAGVVVVYVAATLAYSLSIKRLAVVDVLTLSGLYTTRLAAGGIAAGITLSFWLVAFSTFIFLSLAIAKCCAELEMLKTQGGEAPAGRGYVVDDLPLLLVCGVASGYVAVLVLALYINAMFDVGEPQVQWLLCPLMLCWINRIWIKTHRNQMHDDPIVFALHDWPSIATLAMTILLFVFAG